jgi:plastocyanin
MAIQKESFNSEAKRYAGAIVLVLVAFVASYNFATASSQANAAGGGGFLAQAGGGGGCCSTGGGAPAAGFAGAPSAAGGGCCGGGSSEPIEAATTVEGDVQTIAVDTSNGSFDPNTIFAEAGIPIEMTFSQAPGGCMAGVYMPDFDVLEDLTGGPQTITLPALEPGEYPFYCQMQMIAGTIVVE